MNPAARRSSGRGEDPAALLDLTGVGLLTAASALLAVPLIQGRELGRPAWTYGMMAAAVVLFALFVVSQRHSGPPGHHTVAVP